MGRHQPRRWHDWVIVLGIFGLGGTGVWTLWGGDIRRLFTADEPPAETAAPEATPAPPAATPPPVAPPPGQAAGPF